MKIKEKKCKGQNKAINFDGCGGLVLVRTYGLCSTCYDSWLKTTPEGKEQLYKHAIKHVTNIRKIKPLLWKIGTPNTCIPRTQHIPTK
jgi:Fe-S cluster biogenesis protein NfuA